MDLIMGASRKRSRKSRKLTHKKNHEMRHALDEITKGMGFDNQNYTQQLQPAAEWAMYAEDSQMTEMMPERLLATGI